MNKFISKACNAAKVICNRVSNRVKNTKRATLTIMSLAICMLSMAQSKGAGGFTSATTEISSYQQPVQKLLYAIAGVITLVGAFNIYFKMQNGDQDVKKTIMMTIGGCVAFVAAATALPAFFK